MYSFRQEELLQCIHCGLCLQACPTYLEEGNEASSPRGRIYLMRAVAEGRIEWRGKALTHIDQCLGCRACEPACPSGVAYGHLIEIARAQSEHSPARPRRQRVAKRLLLNLMVRPAAFAFTLRIGHLLSPLLGGRALPVPLARLLGVHSVVAQLPPIPRTPGRLSSVYPPLGERRGRVAVLTGCVASVLFPQVNRATVAVLQHNGFEVIVPPRQGCCGALHVHNGFPEEGRRLALHLMSRFEGEPVDAIVVNAAGCGSTMKEYGRLFECTPHAERACAFSSKVKDVMEFLAEVGVRAPQRPLVGRDGKELVVTYHDACHLAHAQGIRQQPREVIRGIPRVRLVELPEAEVCCGSAGIYNLLQPEMAARLLRRKVDRIVATGAEAVLTGNPGCLAWLAQGLRTLPRPVEVLHPVELLSRAYDAPHTGR
ncbi:MAG: heterodisulfide reductase-related iron-sulfur binding cluster [Armatimonadota bacterium]|nr:heterodisulfide reductase-related iron-sulfur binding cluster [bacterium]MCS7309234.1 heterodisulfide reductase-related iron-sulfur binding cluster [Armatimonadota bacterium]MDW8289629.1 heterodisulfide reductase-related iron-sulfur binding cluster [Armatimonadota bacterium]